jgi:apolipoprotein N-acyltransferase
MERASSLLKSNALFVTGGVRRNSKDENFNSIFLLKARELKFIYDKKILFPYSETPLFGFTAGAFYNSPDRFVKGKTPSSSAIDGIVYAFSICFENLYPSEIRQRMKFSDILITVANDSWFGETEEPYMQVYSTISRAVENRRSIIRAANTGISLCVSPSGDILTQSELNQEATLSAALPLIKNKGLFSRTGNIIIILFSLIIIADLIKREFLKTT